MMHARVLNFASGLVHPVQFFFCPLFTIYTTWILLVSLKGNKMVQFINLWEDVVSWEREILKHWSLCFCNCVYVFFSSRVASATKPDIIHVPKVCSSSQQRNVACSTNCYPFVKLYSMLDFHILFLSKKNWEIWQMSIHTHTHTQSKCYLPAFRTFLKDKAEFLSISWRGKLFFICHCSNSNDFIEREEKRANCCIPDPGITTVFFSRGCSMSDGISLILLPSGSYNLCWSWVTYLWPDHSSGMWSWSLK